MNYDVKDIKKARLKIMVAMLVWGSVGIFVKEIELSSIEIAFYRSIIGCIFIFILSLINKEKFNFQEIKKDIKLLLASGISLASGWVLLFQGYKYTTIGNATLSYYIAPVFIVILSAVLLKEKITLKKALCILGAMVGLVFIVNTKSIDMGESNHTLGIIFSLFAAVFYAIVIIINKLLKNLPSTVLSIIQLLISAIVLLPLIISGPGIQLSILDKKSLIMLLIVGILHTGIIYLMYFSSVKYVEGQTIAVLSYIDPIFAVILSGILLNERLTSAQIIGGVLILGSTFISEYKTRNISLGDGLND